MDWAAVGVPAALAGPALSKMPCPVALRRSGDVGLGGVLAGPGEVHTAGEGAPAVPEGVLPPGSARTGSCREVGAETPGACSCHGPHHHSGHCQDCAEDRSVVCSLQFEAPVPGLNLGVGQCAVLLIAALSLARPQSIYFSEAGSLQGEIATFNWGPHRAMASHRS